MLCPVADEPADLLRQRGIQVTAQRLAVLRAVARQPHIAADAVADVVRADIGAISLQAVYDALGLLAAEGLIRRIQPAGSPARFEDRVGDNHHHLICRRCNRVVDVACAIGSAPCLTAADDLGYEIDSAEVIYWGVCPDCSHTTAIVLTPLLPETRRIPMSNDATGCPVPHATAPHPTRGSANRMWWPNQLNLKILREEPRRVESDGRGLRLRRGVPAPRPCCREEGHRGGVDDIAGLVASRLRALRAVHHPDGVAQRRHLPRSATAAAAVARASSGSRRSTAGRTT